VAVVSNCAGRCSPVNLDRAENYGTAFHTVILSIFLRTWRAMRDLHWINDWPGRHVPLKVCSTLFLNALTPARPSKF